MAKLRKIYYIYLQKTNRDMKRIITLIAATFITAIAMASCGDGKVIKITSTEQFNEIKLPAVVDFYADWCGPCRKIAPIMDELAQDYEGKVNFYKVDVDVCNELAAAFGISSIPAVLFIPEDGEPQMTVGSRGKSQFITEIETILLDK